MGEPLISEAAERKCPQRLGDLRTPCPRCPRLPWRLHEPLQPAGGWRWRGCARRLGVGRSLVGPWVRWEGPGWRWSPQLSGLSSDPGRSACSPAACLREPQERPAGQCFPGAGLGRRSLQFRDACRVGRPGLTCCLARPVAATATAERGVARFVCARQGGGGPGTPGAGGGASAGGAEQREGEGWGLGSKGPAPPRSHPC